MGLTVAATFENQGVYFAGSTLECHIRFSNERGSTVANGSNNNHFLPPASESSSHAPSPYNNNSRHPSATSRRFTSRYRSQRPTGTNNASEFSFPVLEHDNSDYSESVMASPVLLPNSNRSTPTTTTRRYSSASPALAKTNGHYRPSPLPSNGAVVADNLKPISPNRSNGMAVFPAINDRKLSTNTANIPPQIETPRSVHNSLVGMRPGERSPSVPRRLPSSSGNNAHGSREAINSLNHHSANDTNGKDRDRFPRLSTSSVLSTPSNSLTSWLPFGLKQQQLDYSPQQQIPLRRPVVNTVNDGTPSEAGSTGLLSSIWKNLSGQSTPATRPNTRSGTITDSDLDFGVERLAIGFAEASGSLGLASSYIKPEQMEHLILHKGTNSSHDRQTKSPPIGGALGSWVPTNAAGARTQNGVPLLISSPTVLFSELVMEPGESQTFSLKILLPKSIPPSFRGRAACIAYDLVVVAKRNMLESSAYVVRIPFRVLARVGTDGSLNEFPMDSPVRMQPNHSKLTFQESASVATPRNASPSLSISSNGISIKDGEDHNNGNKLTNSAFLQKMLEYVDSSDAVEPARNSSLPEQPAATGTKTTDEEEKDLSQQNIRNACWKRAPVSFSLSEDGFTLASVWLPRRVYQLGEMVTGKIEFHRGSRRVYQVSIWLESVEAVSERFANYEPERTQELTRRVSSEHHESCSHARILGFSLASQPTAAASFSSSIVSNIWQLRIELIIGRIPSNGPDLDLSVQSQFPSFKHRPTASYKGEGPTAGRMRSSTMVAGAAAAAAAAPPGQGMSNLSIRERAVRKRYDAIEQLPAQTLSCTVPIQMYPSLSKASLSGHKDSFTIDLAKS